MEGSTTVKNISNLIKNIISEFWEEVMIPLTIDQYIIFILRVGYINGNYASLSNIQKVNNKDLSKVLETFVRLSDIKSEDYFNLPVNKLIISYKLISADNLKVKRSKITEIKSKDVTPVTRILGYNFPNTTDINLFGDIIKTGYNYYIIRKPNSNLIFKIVNFNDHNHVIVTKDSDNIIEFRDYFTDDHSTFTRIVNDQTFIYTNGIIQIKKVLKKVSYLSSISPNTKIVSKFITLDIETMSIDNIMKPYCVSQYDGKKSVSYYLSDFNSSEEMIIYALLNIIKAKNHGY